MKRTAATFLMVAGLGGCVSPEKATDSKPGVTPFGQASRGKEIPGTIGPNGAPLMAKATPKPSSPTKGQLPSPSAVAGSGVVQTSATTAATPADAGVQQAAGFSRVIGHSHGHVVGGCTEGCTDGGCGVGGHFAHGGGVYGGPKYDPQLYGPTTHGLQMIQGKSGIFPVPSWGPPGAVAAIGAYGAAGGPPGSGPMYLNQRTMIRFVNPAGMRIAWQAANGTFTDSTPLEAPARYNFPQGSVYRLKLTGIPNRPGVTYYPTLEVYPATPDTVEFLSHAAVPVGLTDEDLDQVRAGNLVVKVVYLPNRAYQDLAAVAGAEEVVSTRLEPGVDPIVEANRRGTILAVLRIGNIDLQDPNTPPVDSPPGAMPIVPAPTPGVPSNGMIVTPPLDGTNRTPATLPNAAKGPVTATPVSVPSLR